MLTLTDIKVTSLKKSIIKAFDLASYNYINSDENWGDDTDVILYYSQLLHKQQNKGINIYYAGSGSGYILYKLVSADVKLFQKVVGVDLSYEMVNISKSLLMNKKILKSEIDVRSDDFTRQNFREQGDFDLLICLNNTLGNVVSNRGKYLIGRMDSIRNFRYLLKKDGLIILSVYNKEFYNFRPNYSRFLTLDKEKSNFNDSDFIFSFSKDSYEKLEFYSHWFSEDEIKSLLKFFNFEIISLLKRNRRLIVIANKI